MEAGPLDPGMVLGVEAGETTVMEDRDMATTKQKTATKKAATKATASKPKQAAKTKKDDAPDRVFAIRVTTKELDAIHKAAGPRNATKFIRRVAAAFAAGDEGVFKTVLREAREARS